MNIEIVKYRENNSGYIMLNPNHLRLLNSVRSLSQRPWKYGEYSQFGQIREDWKYWLSEYSKNAFPRYFEIAHRENRRH